MDGTNRNIVLAIFLLVIAVGVLIGWTMIQSQRTKVEQLSVELAQLRQQPQSNPSIARTAPQIKRGKRRQVPLLQRQRTASLQALLKKKDELLRRQNELLKKSAAEKEALQKETRSHLALIVQLAEKQDSNAAVAEEVTRLRSQIAEADGSESERMTEVETLQTRLTETENALDELRNEAEALLAVAENEAEIMVESARSVIAAAGAAAVPPLQRLLADERPVVLIWAANELAAIGADAATAVEPLTALLDHRNQAVRDAASAALRAIVD